MLHQFLFILIILNLNKSTDHDLLIKPKKLTAVVWANKVIKARQHFVESIFMCRGSDPEMDQYLKNSKMRTRQNKMYVYIL